MSSESRFCHKCHGDWNETLIETFPTWDAPSGGPHYVCHSCLIGTILPVIRPSTEQWEFGQVERVESLVSKAHFRFMDGQCEWVVIPPRPFRSYIHNYRSTSTTPASRSMPFPEDNSEESLDDEEESSHGTMDDEEEEREPATSRRRLFFGYVAGGVRGHKDTTTMTTTTTTTTMVSSPRRVIVTTGSYHPPHREKPSGASISSSLSLSTLGSPSPFATPDSKRSSQSSRLTGEDLSPKYSQKLWTPEEDRLLLEAVSGLKESHLKWSMVAQAVPNRSGKQCRERYLNHLTPNIKLKNWSPVEDAIIFRLYHTDGSKWSMMSKLIRGRTDNGIKNRYHHLKRRLERQVQLILESNELLSTMARLMEVPLVRKFENFMIKYAASEIVQPGKALEESEVDGYLRLATDEVCSRCGMVAPSKQTGRLMCKTTGWCEVCVRISPCISGDILRAIGEAWAQSTVPNTT